ncbi:hypothetical protein BC829DRAFT_217161 [Chytridium lagenaria]|nr:hypothetical protein BC829DRAFT_217161 [Chytridium lagenaria]
MKIVERRSAQLVKDLQKQLMKEKRQKEAAEDVRENEIDSGRTSMDSKTKSRQSMMLGGGDASSILSTDKHKVDMITGDLLKLAQENEQLNKRARYAEEEMKTLHEKLTKLNEQFESKSKILQQYMLREYSSQLQPDEKQKNSFNVNILSSGNAMAKMDPAILSQVNTKMQKLLEDLASKVMNLEERTSPFVFQPTRIPK